MGANIRYKDSVFSALFSDPPVLRELYSALTGISLPPDVPVTINTLSDVLFMERINDISFIIGNVLVILIEHQSTINPNMALRLLIYIARVYEELLGDRNIYTTRALTIPRPEFFVLYNGTAPYPDEGVLRLSDAFEKLGKLGVELAPIDLELVVRVININEGRNEGIVSRCRVLEGYRAFIGKVRGYRGEGKSLEEAIGAAVVYCRSHEILKEFLERHGTEVMGMLTAEWKLDEALAVQYKEGREKGQEEGWEKGQEKFARNALAEGMSPDAISRITGLDIAIVKELAGR